MSIKALNFFKRLSVQGQLPTHSSLMMYWRVRGLGPGPEEGIWSHWIIGWGTLPSPWIDRKETENITYPPTPNLQMRAIVWNVLLSKRKIEMKQTSWQEVPWMKWRHNITLWALYLANLSLQNSSLFTKNNLSNLWNLFDERDLVTGIRSHRVIEDHFISSLRVSKLLFSLCKNSVESNFLMESPQSCVPFTVTFTFGWLPGSQVTGVWGCRGITLN